MLMKTWLINVLDNTIEINDPQEGDNNATILTVDFTGCGVDSIPKWVDFVMADGTMLPASLGNDIICTYNISNLITKDGNLHLQAYATNGTTITYKGKIFRVPIKRSLNVSGNTSEYDVGVVEALQDAISDALLQVDEIWTAYEAGTLGGASAYQVAVNNGFVGTEADWLLSLKGADGVDGIDGVDGTNGADGVDGLSAYQVALANGFVGTEEEWLLSLKGDDGQGFIILGRYDTLIDLQTAHSVGTDGDAWSVGTVDPYDVYVWNSDLNDWDNIGQISPSNDAYGIIYNGIIDGYLVNNVKEALDTIDTSLAGKAPISHTHITSDVTGLDTALSGKAPISHTHTIANVLSLQGTLDSKQPNLVSGTNIKTINSTSLLGSGDLAIPTTTYTVYTATIPSASWTGASAPFSKAVAITDLLSTDEPIIDLVLTGTYATDVTMRENWSKIYRGVTSANTIIFYADSVPSADISIQLVVVR